MTSATSSRLVRTDELKKAVGEVITISQVAEQLCDIELKEAGSQSKGLCPLHGEDTPSFFVHDGKGLYHCFGCGAGGDAIELVRAVHHVGFHDALWMLAEQAGIEVSEYVRTPTAEEKERDELAAWIEGWLARGSKSPPRVTAEIAADFGVVVPPKEPRDSGWFKGHEYLLRGDVVFPYRTATGRLTGFKVRDGDKQFGTPNEFPLAAPSMFGLQVARHHVVNGVIGLVEGEYDTMAMHEYGMRDVVGMGGSKFPDALMGVLTNLKVREAWFLFDGDEAGRQGAEYVAKRYWNDTGVRVRVGTCPVGSDPEDLVRSVGAEFVQALVGRLPDALEWLLRQEFEREPRETMGAKLAFIKWIQQNYGGQLNGMQEAVVLKDVAVWLGVPEADVIDFARAEKSMLQAVDSEKVVLGRCVRDGGYFTQVRKRLARDDFYVIKHQRLWDVMSGLMMDGLQFEATVVKRHAEGQGVDPEYVELLAETGDTNIGWHEDQVIDHAVRRGAQQDADRFRELVADFSTPANQLIGTLTHSVTSRALGRGSGAFREIADQVDEFHEDMVAQMRNPTAIKGLDLGSQFPRLSRTLQGLQRRRLVTLAATSGKGKSTIGIQWLTGLAVHGGVPCDFVSLEMDHGEVIAKAASHLTGVDSQRITGGAMDKDEARRVVKALALIRKSPLRVYAPDGITPSEFVLYCREAVMERRSEVFVLDFIQQIGPDADTRRLSRYEQLGEASYMIKQKVCRGLDVCCIVLAQLKREAAGKEEPTPEDMGDSYEIVRASDVILLLNEVDNSYELWVGKNRQGPGQILLPADYDKPGNTWRESQGTQDPDYRLLS